MILSSEELVAKKKRPVSQQIPAVRDLSVVLKDSPPGVWVALSHDEKRVVGTAVSMKAAAFQAQLNGEEDPVLVRMPPAGEGLAADVR
jgi:hypothetical protein